MDDLPRCALDDAGRRAQGERYVRLRAWVVWAAAEDGAIVVDFGAALDRDLLEEALAIERECCPFFVLEFDTRRRRLRASVREADHLPALDALAEALGAPRLAAPRLGSSTGRARDL